MPRSVPVLFAASLGALTLLASAPLAQAQSSDMTVQQFLTIGHDIPRNRAVAIMRPDTRRLIRVVTGAVSTVKAEQASAVSAGRTPASWRSAAMAVANCFRIPISLFQPYSGLSDVLNCWSEARISSFVGAELPFPTFARTEKPLAKR